MPREGAKKGKKSGFSQIKNDCHWMKKKSVDNLYKNILGRNNKG